MISFLTCCFKEPQITPSEEIDNNGSMNNTSSLRTLVQTSGSMPDQSWAESCCNYQQCCDFKDCCNCSGFCYHYNLGQNSAIQFNSNVGPLYQYYQSQSCSGCYFKNYPGSSLFGSIFSCFFNNQLIIDKSSTPLSNTSFDKNFGNTFCIMNGVVNQHEFQITEIKPSSNQENTLFMPHLSPRSQISHNPSRSTADTTMRLPPIIPSIRPKRLEFD